jgi:hypothetical protein
MEIELYVTLNFLLMSFNRYTWRNELEYADIGNCKLIVDILTKQRNRNYA